MRVRVRWAVRCQLPTPPSSPARSESDGGGAEGGPEEAPARHGSRCGPDGGPCGTCPHIPRPGDARQHFAQLTAWVVPQAMGGQASRGLGSLRVGLDGVLSCVEAGVRVSFAGHSSVCVSTIKSGHRVSDTHLYL